MGHLATSHKGRKYMGHMAFSQRSIKLRGCHIFSALFAYKYLNRRRRTGSSATKPSAYISFSASATLCLSFPAKYPLNSVEFYLFPQDSWPHRSCFLLHLYPNFIKPLIKFVFFRYHVFFSFSQTVGKFKSSPVGKQQTTLWPRPLGHTQPQRLEVRKGTQPFSTLDVDKFWHVRAPTAAPLSFFQKRRNSLLNAH